MIPTEHEGTVAVDAAARKLYETAPASDVVAFGAKPAFDDLHPSVKNLYRNRVLPFVWAALEALPDPRAEAWDAGERAGSDHERAKWYWAAGNRAAMAAAGMPVGRPERPKNPYKEET